MIEGLSQERYTATRDACRVVPQISVTLRFEDEVCEPRSEGCMALGLAHNEQFQFHNSTAQHTIKAVETLD